MACKAILRYRRNIRVFFFFFFLIYRVARDWAWQKFRLNLDYALINRETQAYAWKLCSKNMNGVTRSPIDRVELLSINITTNCK